MTRRGVLLSIVASRSDHRKERRNPPDTVGVAGWLEPGQFEPGRFEPGRLQTWVTGPFSVSQLCGLAWCKATGTLAMADSNCRGQFCLSMKNNEADTGSVNALTSAKELVNSNKHDVTRRNCGRPFGPDRTIRAVSLVTIIRAEESDISLLTLCHRMIMFPLPV